ncbi:MULTISPECIES: nuclease-related domain-containing protein [Cellulomonas]|uniref:nuclease-related domain-containing protein n=1 Tax=Cellulomonas TaxID=1707 RepID=UPI0020C0ED07|nr:MULTISPECIES: nuclease-related domain-containing protein [Cellulomonas]
MRPRDNLPDDAVLLVGTSLQDGAKEREIDLLVVWPELGVAAIEVKGGHAARADGQWWQGSGAERHALDPVGQVQDAKRILLALPVRHGLAAARTRTAHLVALVALPHTSVPGDWDARASGEDQVASRPAAAAGWSRVSRDPR